MKKTSFLFFCWMIYFTGLGLDRYLAFTDSAAIEIFDRAEVQPAYPGGPSELMKFLSKNIIYPKKAQENGLEGKIIVKFYIDIDGSVRDPQILKDGVGGGDCAAEAIRVINSMPKWIPGSQRGQAVRVYYTLPISFKLDNAQFFPAKYVGDEIALMAYKKNVTDQIKKSKKDAGHTISIEVGFTVGENGVVSNPVIIQSDTKDGAVKQQILDAVLKMPMWSPEVYNGKPRASYQRIFFTF